MTGSNFQHKFKPVILTSINQGALGIIFYYVNIKVQASYLGHNSKLENIYQSTINYFWYVVNKICKMKIEDGH